jgi:hypothetical protein
MALTQINGNQISTSTQALITQLSFLNTDSILRLPAGTTAQRPTGVAFGTLRFNTTEDKVEVYVNNADGQGTDGWSFVGAGGPHVGTKETSYIRTNSPIIDENLTIGPVANGGIQFSNAYAAGPVEIANGFTLTIEDSANFYVIGEDSDVAAFENLSVYNILDTVGARIDFSTTRENILSYRLEDFNPSPMVMIDYHSASSVFITNLQGNFNINLRGLPITNINTGGVDANKIFTFKIMWFTGSPAYRPTGTIFLDGNNIGSVRWFGGGAPSLNTNRFQIAYLTLSRITAYTDGSGSTTNLWYPAMKVEEYT